MMAKPMKRREVIRALQRAGCAPRGTAKRGGHDIWRCGCGEHTTAVPRHNMITPGTINSIARQLPCLEEGWLN
ncbi:type II toxin-antitoxin system HicA family toxin [Glycomyces salinus]|uniref:type II toxin-antitoxin system HicA family toxin n=1 Tax=Glycomyces salinus TaxID=980294 RepID=UPI0018EB70CD